MASVIEDVQNEKSLKAYLETLPEDQQYGVSVAIAARAALRVQPKLWVMLSPARQSAELTALVFVRSTLISSVAPLAPTDDMKAAAARAATPFTAFTTTAAFTTAAADAAAFTTAAAADADAAAFTTTAAAAAAAARAAAARFWDEIKVDLMRGPEAQSILKAPLWQSSPVWQSSPEFEREWQETRAAWREAGLPWSYFADWYDDLLAGTVTNWDELEKLALIDHDDWEGDDAPEKVAAHILQILRDRDTATRAKPIADVIALHAEKNALPIAAQMEAILALIEEETERLRGRNPKDDIEADDIRRMRELFEKMHGTLVSISVALPEDGPMSAPDSEEVANLLSVFASEFRKWPRENAADLVDSTCRVTLVGLTAGIFAAFGAPVLAGVAAGGVVFAGKRLADIKAAAKEVTAPTGP